MNVEPTFKLKIKKIMKKFFMFFAVMLGMTLTANSQNLNFKGVNYSYEGLSFEKEISEDIAMAKEVVAFRFWDRDDLPLSNINSGDHIPIYMSSQGEFAFSLSYNDGKENIDNYYLFGRDGLKEVIKSLPDGFVEQADDFGIPGYGHQISLTIASVNGKQNSMIVCFMK